MPHPTKSSYRPDIDGLRAVAVVSVLLFHCNEFLPGGFVGVDIFFVISGYLITLILLRDFDRGTFALVEFWERRIRRILPAFAAVLIPVLIFGYVILLPDDFKELGGSVFSQALMAANFFFWQQGGYFAGPSELKPLLHTWSLAVEEQFYLVFPIGLFWIHKKAKRYLNFALFTLFVASFAMNVELVFRAKSATFFLLPTRAWELLAGSLLASNFVAFPVHRAIREMLAWLGLALVFSSFFCFNSETTFPGWAAMVPVAGTALIIGSNSDDSTFVGKFLGQRLLVAVGLVSYSLYLWHWPILAFLRYTINDCSTSLLFAGCAVSFLLATASFYIVEKPFRTKRVLQKRAPLFIASISYVVMVAIVGLLVFNLDGFPRRFSSNKLAFAENATYSGKKYQTTQSYLETRGFRSIGNLLKEEIDFLIIGDSHAMAVVHVFDEVAKKQGLRGAVATNNTTIPLFETWSSRKERSGAKTRLWNETVHRLAEEQGINGVIFIAAWNCYLKGWTNEQIKQHPKASRDRGYAVSNASRLPSLQGAKASIRHGIEATVDNYSSSKLWIFRQAPEAMENEVARKFARWQLFNSVNKQVPNIGRSRDSHRARSDAEFEIFSTIDRPKRSVKIVDIQDEFFDTNGHSLHYSDTAYYRDVGHVSKSGAGKFYHSAIVEVLQTIALADE